MSLHRLLLPTLFSLLVCFTSHASAQFMFLDANGDGLNDATDHLNPISVPTVVDVYVSTDSNRDGSPAVCDTDSSPLSIISYAINLACAGGAVTYGGFINRRTEMSVSFGEINGGDGTYKNGWGGATVSPPSLYRIATLTITAMSGSPTVEIQAQISGSADVTSFGTQCSGLDGANTYSLGVDWFDTGGLGAPNTGEPEMLEVSAPETTAGSASNPIAFQVTASDLSGSGVVSLSASGLPSGAVLSVGRSTEDGRFTWTPAPSDSGTYDVVFTASNALGMVGQDTTHITVSPPTGPRRPRVSPELVGLEPGNGRTDRLLSTSDDGQVYVDVFLDGDVDEAALSQIGVRVGTHAGRLMTARCPLANLSVLLDMPNLDGVIAPGTCQLLMDFSMPDAGVAGLRSSPDTGLPLTGAVGDTTVIGIVDTGIDVRNDDFIDLGGARLIGYWNQTRLTPGLTPPFPGLGYGTEWSPALMDLVDNWSADSLGHGTHVAGIAAGNGRSGTTCLPGGQYPWVGVAPGARICAVKILTIRKIYALETRIVDAVSYIFQRSSQPFQGPPRPTVVNLSLGSNWGPHDGRWTLDRFINELTGPGKIVVAAAGNDADAGFHASVTPHVGGFNPIELEIPLYSPVSPPGSYVMMEGWFNKQDTISVRVVTPGGAIVGPVPVTSGAHVDTPDGTVSILFNDLAGAPFPPGTWDPDIRLEISITDDHHVISSGTWSIEVGAVALHLAGKVDMYLTQYDLGPDTPSIRFTLGADSTKTIRSPASADSVISVGAYSTRNCWQDVGGITRCTTPITPFGSLTAFSSRGPRRDGVQKPDLCAPGSIVISSKSGAAQFPSDQVVVGGDYVALSGTSQAAPHVAGAVALLLSQRNAGWPTATPSRVRAQLQASARRDQQTGAVPGNAWGYGKLNARAALAPVQSLQFVNPPRGLVLTSHWLDVDFYARGASPFDSVVINLALNGCDPSIRLAKYANVATNPGKYGFLYYVPDQFATNRARLYATGYYFEPTAPLGLGRVEVRTDTLLTFQLAPVTGVTSEAAPKKLTLRPNEPNPFNPVTSISFDVPKRDLVTLRIFAVSGRLSRTVVDQVLSPGTYTVSWDGTTDTGGGAASGVYFMELRSGAERLTRKMTMVR